MKRSLLIIFSCIAILFSFSTNAYELKKSDDGRVLIWNTYRLNVEIDSREIVPGAANEIQAGFYTWLSAGMPFTLNYTQTTSPASGGYDGINTLKWINDEWEYGDDTLGITLSTYYSDTALVIETDILFNAVDKTWSSAQQTPSDSFDLRSVATHEIGHFFGLGHSEDIQSTMYPTTTKGNNATRLLSTDDRLAIGALIDEMNARLNGESQTSPPNETAIVREEKPGVLNRTSMGCSLGSEEANGIGWVILLFIAFRFILKQKKSSIALLLLMICSPSSATIVNAINYQNLVKKADIITFATIVHKRSYWQSGRIYTDYQLKPILCWKERCPKVFTLKILGGHVGGLTQKALGVPHYAYNTQLIVFARKHNPYIRSIGLSQGIFKIRGHNAIRDLRHLHLIDEKQSIISGVKETLALDSLLSILQKASSK